MNDTYRNGKVHVLEDRCSTCVFRPGNLMHLPPGRFKQLVEVNRDNDVAFACHQTLDYAGHTGGASICRGYYDRFKDEITPLVMAQAMDLIEEDPLPSSSRSPTSVQSD